MSLKQFDFMRFHKFFIVLAVIMVLISGGLLAVRGLNLGIDFSGGNLIQLEFPEKVSVQQVRNVLAKQGYGQAVIQSFSDQGILIRMPGTASHDEELREKLVAALDGLHTGKVKVLGFEMVGPAVGKELTSQAIWATSLAMIGILIYITFRFQFRFAVVSVAALFHDTMLVIGLFSLLHREISLPFIAAILTTVGYSLNNTIVILDRVRENMRSKSQKSLAELLNDSINQTLSRTINTSLTTFLPVLVFYIWGGSVLANFSLAIMAGIVVGGFSSICVTGSMLLWWYSAVPGKEKA